MKGFSLLATIVVISLVARSAGKQGAKNYLNYNTDLHGFYKPVTPEHTPKWLTKTISEIVPGQKVNKGKLIYDAGGRFHWFNSTVVHPEHLRVLDQYPELQAVICRESVVELVINPLLIEGRSKLHDLQRGDLVWLSSKWGCVNYETNEGNPDHLLRAIREKVFDDGTQILYNTRNAQPSEALKLAKLDVYSEHNVRERPFHTKKNETYVFSHRKKHLPQEQLQKVKAISGMHKCIKHLHKFKGNLGTFITGFESYINTSDHPNFEETNVVQKKWLGKAWKAIQKGAGKVVQIVKKVIDTVGKVVSKVASLIGKLVAKLGEIAKHIYENVPWVKDIVDKVKNLKLLDIVKGVWNKIKSTINMFKGLLKLLTGTAEVDKTIELLKNWKTGKPLVDFWVSTAQFQVLGASRLGFGVSIPLRFQLTLKFYSCRLFRISLGMKAEAAAVFHLSAQRERRMLYQVEEMSKEWTGLEIPLSFMKIEFRPFIATLLGLFTNVDMQMDPLGYEAMAGWEIAVGYAKGRGWFTEFNKKFQLIKHDGAILSAGSQAYAMIGVKPMVGFRMYLSIGLGKLNALAIKVGETALAVFGIMDISAYAKQYADGTGKKLCVRLGVMYGINFSAGIGIMVTTPFKWNIVGPFTYWKDLWKRKHEFSWCPLKIPTVRLPGRNIHRGNNLGGGHAHHEEGPNHKDLEAMGNNVDAWRVSQKAELTRTSAPPLIDRNAPLIGRNPNVNQPFDRMNGGR